MTVTRVSDFTGEIHSMDLPVTDDQLLLYQQGRVVIQRCFPNLTPEQRDFIKFGCTPEEWSKYVGDEEE
jgi:hypothetical protein